MHFVRMDHNPIDSNPIGATSRWDSLIKPVRIVINLFLDSKMRSSLDIRDIDVMLRCLFKE